MSEGSCVTRGGGDISGPKTVYHKTRYTTVLPINSSIIWIEGTLVIYSTALKLIPKYGMDSLSFSLQFICLFYVVYFQLSIKFKLILVKCQKRRRSQDFTNTIQGRFIDAIFTNRLYRCCIQVNKNLVSWSGDATQMNFRIEIKHVLTYLMIQLSGIVTYYSCLNPSEHNISISC